MQGKIGLEEHFAIPDTLNDSKGFLADSYLARARVAADRHTGAAHRRDGRAGHADDDPVAQRAGDPGIPDAKRAADIGAACKRLPRARGGEAAVALPGPRGARHAGSRRRDARARALREGARLSRRAGERLLADRRSELDGLSGRQALRGLLGRVRAARRAVLSASAQSAAIRGADLRRPSVAARADLGVRAGDGGACAAADGFRSLRSRIRSCRSSSAISAKDCRTASGASTTATPGPRRRRAIRRRRSWASTSSRTST